MRTALLLGPSLALMLLWPISSPVQSQDAGGAAPLLSRCAGKAGGSMRDGDPAFVTLALDGEPWITIERMEEAVGTQPIATTATGTGWRRRRDGTVVHFRFTCMLDDRGQAVLFHASTLLHDLGDRLPPSVFVEGAATLLPQTVLPRGAELQVRLLDLSQGPGEQVLAEQVVRSGLHVPIPFALRLPRDVSLGGRLTITARVVHAHRTLFELPGHRPVTAEELRKDISLVLTAPRSSR